MVAAEYRQRRGARETIVPFSATASAGQVPKYLIGPTRKPRREDRLLRPSGGKRGALSSECRNQASHPVCTAVRAKVAAFHGGLWPRIHRAHRLVRRHRKERHEEFLDVLALTFGRLDHRHHRAQPLGARPGAGILRGRDSLFVTCV